MTCSAIAGWVFFGSHIGEPILHECMAHELGAAYKIGEPILDECMAYKLDTNFPMPK